MRSRFSAYALELYDYIISTTHPGGPQFESDRLRWHMQLQKFSSQTVFEGLQIRTEEKGPIQAFVSFHASLKQHGRDASFSERSLFVLHKGRWLYHSGEPITPPAPADELD